MVANNKGAFRVGARHGIARALFAFTATATIAGGIVGAGGASPAWAADSVQPTPETVRAQGYSKVSFQDEFDGTAVDDSKWGYQYSCFDPKAKTQVHYTDSPENVNVSGGNLHLIARYSPTREKWNKETKRMETVDRTCTRTENGQKIEYAAPFTSAMIQTKDNKGNIMYAAQGDFYAEARIKLPKGRSSWSSFWMTGSKGGWPNNGEIDVFESKGWDPSYVQANVHTPRGSSPSKSEQHQGRFKGVDTTQSEFHTYGVEKNGDSVTFYLDGVRGHTVKYSELSGFNPFAVDGNGMVLRLNQMVGGTFLASDDGKNTEYVDATKYVSDYEGAGSEMLVDYVRVWEKGTNAPTVTETPAPEPTAAPSPEPTGDPAPAPEPTADPVPAPSSEPTAEPAPSPEPTANPAPSPEPSQPADNNAGNVTDVDTAHPGEGTPASRPVENTTGDNNASTQPDKPSVNDNAATGDANKPADKQPETPAPSADKPADNNGESKPGDKQPDTTAPSADKPSANANTDTKPGEATQGKGEGHEQPFRAAKQTANEAGTGNPQVGAAGGSQGVGVHSASALPSTGGNVLVVVAAAGALVAAAAVGLAAVVVNRKSKRG